MNENIDGKGEDTMGGCQRLKYGFILTLLLFTALPAVPAKANLLDKISDIYHVPDKVDELSGQLEEQTRKLAEAELSLKAYGAEQVRIREENEQYRLQNEQLRAQNQQLAERLMELEQDKADKQSVFRKWIIMIGTAIALIVGYVLSVRLWRYSEWRRRK